MTQAKNIDFIENLANARIQEQIEQYKMDRICLEKAQKENDTSNIDCYTYRINNIIEYMRVALNLKTTEKATEFLENI